MLTNNEDADSLLSFWLLSVKQLKNVPISWYKSWEIIGNLVICHNIIYVCSVHVRYAISCKESRVSHQDFRFKKRNLIPKDFWNRFNVFLHLKFQGRTHTTQGAFPDSEWNRDYSIVSFGGDRSFAIPKFDKYVWYWINFDKWTEILIIFINGQEFQ